MDLDRQGMEQAWVDSALLKRGRRLGGLVPPENSLQARVGDLRALARGVVVLIYLGELEGYLVPQSAVMTSDKGKAVMVVGPDNKVTPRPVDAGSWQGSQWVIKKGLSPGDKVIIDNLVKLRPGMPVSPHPPMQAAAAPPAQSGAPQDAAPRKPGSATPDAAAPNSNSSAKQ